MRKQPHDTTATNATVAPPDHLALLEEAKATIAGLFGRREPRATFWDLVIGLLMGLPTANCWTISEAVGHRSPYRLQHLLSRAVWDGDAVLARIARWIISHLGGAPLTADPMRRTSAQQNPEVA